MKKITEWYEQLPEPIRSQALANYNLGNKEANCLAQAIQRGFVWNVSPEGYNYWFDIYFKAKEGHYDKPDLATALDVLEKSLNELQTALEEVRKAIRNES